MRRMVWVALFIAALLATSGLVWAHGPARTAPALPSASPAHGPGQTHGAMSPVMQDPEATRSMMDACVQAMQDPQMQRHMWEHMSGPGMRRTMGDTMRSMPGMPMMPMMPR
ncbi:MAG: hypothetical protein QN196_08725 [Armatimonadota bacterium]|nr:hypothetical protein [Armatimonadota bacterium]MDR7406256.1 hypothetical protein [Armatimonadota bacterium]MDR7432099.1 hypothetical protein [Armatimonadota bacterium]MDR7604613.1 hypothetical protein [Armatimonadota bacterium]MDR7605943.1 hypothetical protein [Armatimonadota bacterium]